MKNVYNLPQQLIRALRPIPVLAITSALLPLGLCGAQEVDAPTHNGGSGSVVAPSAWVTLFTPVMPRVDLKLSEFYIGELDVPVAQADLTVHATSFLSITPSYMNYSAPARALNKLAPNGAKFTRGYDEQQFRIDGTLGFTLSGFELSARNMYVRRFRPDGLKAIDRYRGRLAIAHPLDVVGSVWKPFASWETYYDRNAGGWNRDRYSAGVTLPLMQRVLFQPSYMYERTDGTNDVHYLLFGLMIGGR
jgi:hypothetical protein